MKTPFEILDIVGRNGGTIESDCGKIVVETPTENLLKITVYDRYGEVVDEILYSDGTTINKGK